MTNSPKPISVDALRPVPSRSWWRPKGCRSLLALLLMAGATSVWAQVIQQPITPAPGAGGTNAEAGARRTLERSGYQDVRGLRANSDGSWTGRATRGRVEWTVTIDSHGNIIER